MSASVTPQNFGLVSPYACGHCMPYGFAARHPAARCQPVSVLPGVTPTGYYCPYCTAKLSLSDQFDQLLIQATDRIPHDQPVLLEAVKSMQFDVKQIQHQLKGMCETMLKEDRYDVMLAAQTKLEHIKAVALAESVNDHALKSYFRTVLHFKSLFWPLKEGLISTGDRNKWVGVMRDLVTTSDGGRGTWSPKQPGAASSSTQGLPQVHGGGQSASLDGGQGVKPIWQGQGGEGTGKQ